MEQTMIEIRQMRQEAANQRISWATENAHRWIENAHQALAKSQQATENVHQALAKSNQVTENVRQANEELLKVIKTQDETCEVEICEVKAIAAKYEVIRAKYKAESSIHELNIMLSHALNALNEIEDSLNRINEELDELDRINNNNQNE